MSKYNYDKTVLKRLSTKPFMNEVATREAAIADAMPYDILAEFNANVLANKLHPGHIVGYVKKIIEHNKDCKTLVIAPQETYGFKSLPYYRAGQYISIGLQIGSAFVSRPYTLSSNPALCIGDDNNEYHITIKRKNGGFVSNYLLDCAYNRMELVFSAPIGDFYYDSLRDKKDVIAVAGGSGITPFISMASAIAAGIEDFNLTILYGSVCKSQILLKDELDEICKSSRGKVKVIYVLSDEEKDFNTKPVEEELAPSAPMAADADALVFEKEGAEISVDSQGNVTETILKAPTLGELASGLVDNSTYEHGFISADVIKKYTPVDGEYSLFVCGPKAMYDYLEGEVSKLGLPRRLVRYEVSGEFGNPEADPNYPAGVTNDEFNLKVTVHGEVHEIKCKRTETLINAIEKAGIQVTTDCRSGSCGWCHSRLISGKYFIPTGRDVRKIGDKKFNWIHPCITYPLSDIEIEVFPSM